MSVTSIASNVYSQYQSTLDGLKNGNVSYLEALGTYQETVTQARGLSASAAKGYTEQDRVRDGIPAAVIEKMQSVLAKSDHIAAAKAYQDAGGERANGAGTQPGTSSNSSHGWGHIATEARMPFNAEAYGYLSGYASAHKSEWMDAAKALDLSIEGGMYLFHFYRQPEGAGYDVSVGKPNSQAEQIFRHIASPADVAEFEARMAPAQKVMENRMTDLATDLVGHMNEKMKAFAPHVPAMEAAGLMIEDIAGALIAQGGNGEYKVVSATEKSATIEAFVNGNPEVRALFEAAWNRSNG